jgi:hypothetical protein
MHRLARTAFVALALLAAPPLAAQDVAPVLVVKTFELKHLLPAAAAQLVSPYVVTPNGGVYEAGRHLITVRETKTSISRIEEVLREHDRASKTLTFRFQLIAAEEAATTRDPAIAGIDSVLRGLFRFAGYRLLSQGVATVDEFSNFSLTLAAGDERVALSGEVGGVENGGTRGRINVRISLQRAATNTDGKRVPEEPLLGTGLTVPLGETVVIGSAVPGGRIQALVLTVRPDVAGTPQR